MPPSLGEWRHYVLYYFLFIFIFYFGVGRIDKWAYVLHVTFTAARPIDIELHDIYYFCLVTFSWNVITVNTVTMVFDLLVS